MQKNGDTLSGGLTFENDSILAWIRNTDWAKIGFKNNADSDTDSYMWFETGDNGNEYFKWRSRQSTTTKDLMTLKWDALSVLVKALFSSEVKISTVNALRIFNSSFGAIFRRSEECLHIIPTRENEGENGDIGPLRPFTLNLRTGRISMGHGLDVTGDIFANRFAINSSTGMWIHMRDQNVILGRNAVSTDGAQALLRQDHADRKFMIGGLGNKQFGIYMINNSRTANGTDGQAYMDNNGNWLCGAQVIPGNYGNFDSRYVRDVRLGTRVVQTMQKGVMYEKSGHAITGLGIIGAVDGDDPAVFRPIQKYINGTWYNLAWIQHRNVRTTTGRVFIGFCTNLFHIRSWIVHQRMCHTILKCEAEKLLRPHIQSALLHVDIFCIFPDFCRRFLTQYCRLCKYAPNILLDAFFIHRK